MTDERSRMELPQPDRRSSATSATSATFARERTRSDSGKENAASALRGQRHRSLVRYTESVMASTLAAVAALSASDDAPGRRQSASPVEFGATDSALPSDSDHGPWGDQHSSEEELECINETAMLAADDAADAVVDLKSRGAPAVRFGPGAFGPPGDADPRLHKRSASNPQQVALELTF